MAKTDILHDRIDASEEIRAQAKDRALQVWRERLRPALRAASEGDRAHVGSRITEALEILSGELAVELSSITSDALKIGGRLGAETVRSQTPAGEETHGDG